nr:hypothetical protein [Lachnospiraceae bacterium]
MYINLLSVFVGFSLLYCARAGSQAIFSTQRKRVLTKPGGGTVPLSDFEDKGTVLLPSSKENRYLMTRGRFFVIFVILSLDTRGFRDPEEIFNLPQLS